MASSLDQIRTHLIRADQDDRSQAVAIIPNVAVVESLPVGHDLTVVGISVLAATLPLAPTGTYLLTIAVSGTSLLVAANFDLKTIAVADTLEVLALSAVGGALNLSATDVIKITCTSNTLDLTGTGLSFNIKTISR